MSERGFLGGLKSFLIQAGAGFLASAAAAWLTIPGQNIELGTLAIGIIVIPIALGLAVIGCSLYGVFVVIKVVDAVATKMHLFDADDIS
jgi:hypothetical protein